tara:strand:- start:358 stop:558 length:201 start_codon:yes stop_codon:yes gene_type:complete
MTAKTSESIEVAAAIIVTAGLVMGNLLLFSPLRTDNRTKPPKAELQRDVAADPAPEQTFVSAAVQP